MTSLEGRVVETVAIYNDLERQDGCWSIKMCLIYLEEEMQLSMTMEDGKGPLGEMIDTLRRANHGIKRIWKILFPKC